MRTTKEIRQLYLEFFKSKGHTIIPSASLIPENDPTVLFTPAGMHPLVPYLLAEEHPGGKRLANIQKCIRTSDIDEVGDDVHLTFFEMLGNWSLGDYWKKEAIEMSFEFLTSPSWLGLNKNLIAVSVFRGDNDAPFDEETSAIWKNLGIPENRIAKLSKKSNWWGPAGETGPCGPDTEMFYWSGNPNEVPELFNEENPLWVEIWNDVFMEYDRKIKSQKSPASPSEAGRVNLKNEEERYEFFPLKQKNVDTGMGLERTVTVLNNCDLYQIDAFKPIIEVIETLSGKRYGSSENTTRSMRVVADHIRAAAFILGDERGVFPSNVGHGYVLRRLIRRAVRHGKSLGIKEKLTHAVAAEVIKISQSAYPELLKNKERILTEMEKEEEKFASTLERGLKEFSKLNRIDGKIAFDLYQSYGFPLELTEELAKENGFTVDKRVFEEEFKKHQELSRTASAGTFSGGLADHSEHVVKYHTATHLLHKALREVLGEHVEQRGSNITAERLRFDFSHPQKMTQYEIEKVEKIVREKINENLPVHFKILTIEEAKKQGAIGLFEEKYRSVGEKVKVYFIGNYSAEICGGPHVSQTGEIGNFKIVKEGAVAAGIRRIKGII